MYLLEDPQISFSVSQDPRVQKFHHDLQSAQQDCDKLAACLAIRDDLLRQHDHLEHLFADVREVMQQVCGHDRYNQLIAQPGSEENHERWISFENISDAGVKKRNRTAALRVVGELWSEAVVNRYGWATCNGDKYWQKLGAAARNNPDWNVAVRKLNRLILWRVQQAKYKKEMPKKINPISQSHLTELAKWNEDSWFLVQKTTLLPYEDLTRDELPSNTGFDQFGLLVHEEYADSCHSRHSLLQHSELRQKPALPNVQEVPIRRSSRLSQKEGAQQPAADVRYPTPDASDRGHTPPRPTLDAGDGSEAPVRQNVPNSGCEDQFMTDSSGVTDIISFSTTEGDSARPLPTDAQYEICDVDLALQSPVSTNVESDSISTQGPHGPSADAVLNPPANRELSPIRDSIAVIPAHTYKEHIGQDIASDATYQHPDADTEPDEAALGGHAVALGSCHTGGELNHINASATLQHARTAENVDVPISVTVNAGQDTRCAVVTAFDVASIQDQVTSSAQDTTADIDENARSDAGSLSSSLTEMLDWTMVSTPQEIVIPTSTDIEQSQSDNQDIGGDINGFFPPPEPECIRSLAHNTSIGPSDQELLAPPTHSTPTPQPASDQSNREGSSTNELNCASLPDCVTATSPTDDNVGHTDLNTVVAEGDYAGAAPSLVKPLALQTHVEDPGINEGLDAESTATSTCSTLARDWACAVFEGRSCSCYGNLQHLETPGGPSLLDLHNKLCEKHQRQLLHHGLETVLEDVHVRRKRRASEPADDRPQARARLQEYPIAEDIYHTAFVDKMLRRLHDSRLPHNTRGFEANERMTILLDLAQLPQLTGQGYDALVMSQDELKKHLNAGALLEGPVFTYREELMWDSAGPRPIEQMIKRMPGAARMVNVQIPSVTIKHPSAVPKSFEEVAERFSSNEDTEDPWNVLEWSPPVLYSPTPLYVDAEDCQLLNCIDNLIFRDAALKPMSPNKEWTGWMQVSSWAIMAQGGAVSLPHVDSLAWDSWLAIQEGQFGFGWFSKPTPADRQKWMGNKQRLGSWKICYYVLQPGQTVFIPSGTIHFVFRTSQTLALGGHFLRWSQINKWLTFWLEQLEHPGSSNDPAEGKSDFNLCLKLLTTVEGLINERQRRGLAAPTLNMAEFYKLIKDVRMNLEAKIGSRSRNKKRQR